MSLARQMVRHSFAGFAGTFAAVAAGVALVTCAVTLWLSAQPQIPERYADTPALVRSPQIGTDRFGNAEFRPWSAAEATDLAARIAAVPGVTAAVPDPVFYAQRVTGGRATGDPEESRSAGHAWSSAALGGHRLTAGRPPRAPGEVALAGVAPGTTVDVLVAAGPVTWTVTGTTDGPGFYVADGVAAQLATGVHAIGVLTTDPGAVPAGDGTLLTGADRAQLEPERDSRTRWIGAQLLIAMLGLGLFVAVFVVSSTAALSATQRRREIGLLRAVGATPGQVRRLMYGETLVVATLAGLAGVPLGALTAPLLADPLIAAGLEPASFTVTAQPLAWAAAFAVGVLVALAGVTVAARRTSRIPPLDALREAAVDRRAMTAGRWIFGMLAAAGGAALLITLNQMPVTSRSTAGMLAAMLLLTSAALLAPVLLVPLVRGLTWPVRHTAAGMLVREGTLTGVRRVAATAAPVLLAVGFTVLLAGTVATIEEATGLDETAKIEAGHVLAPDGTPGLTEAAVTAQPGRSRLTSRVQLTHGGAVSAYDVTGADLPEGAMVLSPATAGEMGVRAGDDVPLRWADGTTATATVTAVDAKAGAVALSSDLVRAHDPDALTEAVWLDGPAVPAAGARALTTREYVQTLIDEEGRLIDVFLWVLIGLSAGYTGLAVANTLLMATASRRPEFRSLRLAGAGTGQVLRVTSAEALLAVLTGTVLGGAVAGLSLLAVSAAVEAELEMPVPVVIPWPAAAAVTLACALVAVLATAIPVSRHRFA